MPPGKMWKHKPKSTAQKVASLLKATKPKRRSKAVKTAQGGVALFNKPSPFPLVWKGAKQAYSALQGLAVGTSGVFGAEQVFRLNSQFDPNKTGGGHQPYGRDTFETIYGRYKVKSVTFEVTFSAPTTGSHLACAITVQNPTNVSGLGAVSYEIIKERPNSRVVILNEGGGKQIVTIKRTYPMYVLLGVTKLQFDSDIGVFDAASGDNPSATAGEARLVVAIADFTKGSVGACTISTKITMNTDWYQRKTLAQS